MGIIISSELIWSDSFGVKNFIKTVIKESLSVSLSFLDQDRSGYIEQGELQLSHMHRKHSDLIYKITFCQDNFSVLFVSALVSVFDVHLSLHCSRSGSSWRTLWRSKTSDPSRHQSFPPGGRLGWWRWDRLGRSVCLSTTNQRYRVHIFIFVLFQACVFDLMP